MSNEQLDEILLLAKKTKQETEPDIRYKGTGADLIIVWGLIIDLVNEVKELKSNPISKTKVIYRGK